MEMGTVELQALEELSAGLRIELWGLTFHFKYLGLVAWLPSRLEGLKKSAIMLSQGSERTFSVMLPSPPRD